MAASPAAVLALAVVLLQSGATRAWDYALNGMDWGELGYCGVGGPQSPIDLPEYANGGGEKGVYLRYPPMDHAFKLYNNGHTIAFTVPQDYKAGFGFVKKPDELITPTAEVYRLWQVNFHSPSEHTLAGQRLPLEMQMVHQRVVGGTKELAIVSVLFKDVVGFRSNFLDALLVNGLPEKAWDELDVNIENSNPAVSDLQDMVKGSSFYTYEGSLTVPPCELNVRYFVRRHSVSALPAQLQGFAAALKATSPPYGNFRNFVPGSTASGQAVIVNSVDHLESPNEKVEPHAGAEGPKQAPGLAPMLNNAEYTTLQADDSEEMKAAKGAYQEAKMAANSAMAAKAAAERELHAAQAAFAASPGPVNKIQQKWAVTNAEMNFGGAQEAFRVAQRKLSQAGARLMEVQQKEDDAKVDKVVPGMTTAAPTEPGSFKLATTVNPYPSEKKPEPKEGLSYEKKVQLPYGPNANPFVKGHLDDVVSVGGESGMKRDIGEMRLAPNLKQLDSPPGLVPVPDVVRRKGFDEDEEGPKMQLIVRLPVDPEKYNGIERRMLGDELARAIEEDGKLPLGSVMVPDIRPNVYSLSPVPFPREEDDAALNQQFVRANVSEHAVWHERPRRLAR